VAERRARELAFRARHILRCKKTSSADVAFGSKASFWTSRPDVRFTPKADMGRTLGNVRFVPLATKVQRSFGERNERQAACAIRVSISLRSAAKSIGLVRRFSAPRSSAVRLVSSSP